MKKIDIGQTISIFANIGVIAGIVFLGIELDQNNDLLAAQARYDLIVRRADMNDTFNDPRMLEILWKYETGKSLTPVERSALYNVTAKLVEMWEWQYHEYTAGMLTLEQLPIANWRRQYHGEDITPNPLREYWGFLSDVASPDFVQFMKENVTN
jgi:hypothetical protein